MATKVKPSRLNVTGTPQVGQVPVYVDEDSFQWGAGGGGGDVKGFTLSSTSDLTTAQAAYDWYKNGKTPVVRYDGGDYLVEFADSSKVILCSTGYHKEIETSYNGRTQNNLLFNLSSDTVTSINTSYGGNLTMYYLSPVVNYGTPYTPQYDGSPATKKYVDDNKTTVVDALNSTSTTSALSANQGKVLDDKIAALFGLGKFLSLWDATTGQPISFPLQTPYTYTTGDYFLVETISSATPPVNYKPTGSSYTGTASSTAETEELEAGDIYIYDGTTWLLQLNHGKTVSFSEIAGQPTDNANLSTALSAKANDNEVVKLTGDQTIAGTKTFSTSPVVPSKTADATNTGTAIATEAQVYKKQDALTLPATPTQGNLVTWGADNETFTDGGAVPTGIPSGGNNGDVLTNVNGTPTWSEKSGGITKIFTLSSTSDLTNAQAAYDWWVTGGNPIIKLNALLFNLHYISSTGAYFGRVYGFGDGPTTLISVGTIVFTISSGSVTAVESKVNNINKSTTAPAVNDGTITLVI